MEADGQDTDRTHAADRQKTGCIRQGRRSLQVTHACSRQAVQRHQTNRTWAVDKQDTGGKHAGHW